MNFKKIIYKNFKSNIKKYSIYYICTIFAIMVFYLYSTIVYNEYIMEFILKNEPVIKNMIIASNIGVGVFSFFFVNYSFSSLMVTRKKEFGILILLGMSKRNIKKIIRLENSLIFLGSLIIGLLLGSIASFMIFGFLRNFLLEPNLRYAYSYKSYGTTFFLFAFIFICSIVVCNVNINKLDIENLINNEKKVEVICNNRWYLGVLGIALIFISFFMLAIKTASNKMILAFILTMLGMFLSVFKLGDTILVLLRKNKRNYYKNLVSITGISKRLAQNKKIILITSLLSFLSIYFIGLSYSSFITSLSGIDVTQPYDLLVTDKQSVNMIDTVEIQNIMDKEDVSITDKKVLEFIQMFIDAPKKTSDENNKVQIDVVSVDNFNKIYNGKLEINKGDGVIITQRDKQEQSKWLGSKLIKITSENAKSYSYNNSSEIWTIITNVIDKNRRMLVLNNSDYENIKSEVNLNSITNYSMINISNSSKGKIIADKIRNENKKLDVNTKIESYETSKKDNLIILFTVTLTGVLFLISAGSVLYIKVYSEIDEFKNRYKKIDLIGIESNKVRMYISNELKIIFFIPAIYGGVIGYMYIIAQVINGGNNNNVLINALVVIFAYIIMQTNYYILMKRKILKEILLSKNDSKFFYI